MSGTRSPRFRSRVSGSKARVRATGPRAVLGQDDAAARLSAEEGPRRGPHRLAARLSEERRLRQQLVAPAARWRGWTTASISVAQHQSHGPSTAHVIFYSGSLATQGRTMRDKIRYNICGSPYDLKKMITSTRGVAPISMVLK